MDTDSKFSLSWLIPNFESILQLDFYPNSTEELSALFVLILIVVFVFFAVSFIYYYFQAGIRLHWLKLQLKGVDRLNVLGKREALILAATEHKDGVGHLWLEFDETLVEVKSGESVLLKNTIDAGHFFNTHTLAKRVTENRLIAAVPGFLTAIGVIGTFVGLQIGLSGLQLGEGFTVDQMKDGVGGVINGAKVAFMTSVWGIALSVLFNFSEKAFEQRIRNSIRNLENLIDHIFPRIRPEEQLKTIAEHSSESRETLQGLAEKIGEKMQEAMVEATQGIQSSLEKSLNDIMAPAINKLVDETSEGNQKALEGLLESFMDGFGKQGADQRNALDAVSQKVNDAVSAMHSTMHDFVIQLQKSQTESGEREKEMIADISLQVSRLVQQSDEIHTKLTGFVEQQISGIAEQLEQREAASAQREQDLSQTIQKHVEEIVTHSRQQGNLLTEFVEKQINGLTTSMEESALQTNEIELERNARIEAQTKAVSELSSQVLTSVEQSIERQVNASSTLIEQGKALQTSIDTSVQANAKATDAMRESAAELRTSADQMRVFSSNINEAGNKLGGAISEAVESTKDLAQQNQLSSEQIEKMRSELNQDVAKFQELTLQLDGLMQSASGSFSELKISQREYINQMREQVKGLGMDMTQLLEDYAEQANSQTAEHLKVWSQSVTDYATQMTSAVRALNNVVDAIEEKVG